MKSETRNSKFETNPKSAIRKGLLALALSSKGGEGSKGKAREISLTHIGFEIGVSLELGAWSFDFRLLTVRTGQGGYQYESGVTRGISWRCMNIMVAQLRKEMMAIPKRRPW